MTVLSGASSLNILIPALQSRRLSAVELIEKCIDRIEAREAVVGAWTYFDASRAREAARAADASAPRGILHGVPIGIKDIIEVEAMPYGSGSEVYRERVGKRDAACVASLRRAGAIILGKTVTTEFGYFRPGKTSNPYNPKHTPGGSSSGSAAAVADGMVPCALGAQTAASVTRPAAYCGVVGFKSTQGAIAVEGVQPLAPSLDSLGWLTRTIEDAEVLRAVMSGETYRSLPELAKPPRIAVCETNEWNSASSAARHVLYAAAHRLEYHGAEIVDLVLPPAFSGLLENHMELMAYEAAQTLGALVDQQRDAISGQLRDLIEKGRSVTADTYVRAKRRAEDAAREFAALFAQYDAVMVPSAPGEAPAGLNGTGDPVFSRVWTLLGGPSVALPVGFGINKLPLGVQLVGPRGADRRVLEIASWAEPRVGPA